MPRPEPPRWARRLVGWIERRNTAVLVTALLLALGASASLTQLRFDVDLTSMLPQGRREFADYARFVDLFGGRNLTVALVTAPDAASATRFADAFADALAARAEVRDVRSRIDLEAFARALRAGALPRLLPIEFHPQVAERLTPQAIDEAVGGLRRALSVPASVGIANRIAGDPLGLSLLLAESLRRARPDRALATGSEYLLSPDGRRLLVLVEPAASDYSTESSLALGSAFDQAEAAARASTGAGEEIGVSYTGAFAYGREDAAILRADLILYSVAAFAAALAIFHLGYRSLEIIPFVAVQLVATSVVTFALGLLVYGSLNVVSLAFAAIFFGLSIDTAIHFYTRFREESAERGNDTEAVAASIGALLQPTAVASGTTAAVFAVIGLSALAGVAQLGYLTAAGMLLNLPATFVLLPAMLLWRRRGGRVPAERARAVLPPTMRLAAIAGFSARHRRAVSLAFLALCVAAGVAARGTYLDTNLVHLRPARSQAASVQREIEASFGVSDPEAVVLVEAEVSRADEAAPASAMRDAALVVTERVRDALARLEQEGLVSRVVTPSPFLPSRATQEARLAAWAALPRVEAAAELERRLAASGFRVDSFAEALSALRAVPAPADAAEPLPGMAMLIDRHLRSTDGAIAITTPFAPASPEVLEAIAKRLPAEIEVPPGVRLTVTGRPLMERTLAREMRSETVWFAGLALASNALLIWLAERSWQRTLAILAVPTGASVVLLGIAHLVGIVINPVNLIVLPLTIGMGVDYCVYLAGRMRESGGDARRAAATSGRALLVTAATTVVGFGVLGLSRYPALSGLGALGAPAMALCFASALAVLPALLSSSGPSSEPLSSALRSPEAPPGATAVRAFGGAET